MTERMGFGLPRYDGDGNLDPEGRWVDVEDADTLIAEERAKAFKWRKQARDLMKQAISLRSNLKSVERAVTRKSQQLEEVREVAGE